MKITLATLVFLASPLGCVQHSPAAKVSTVISISITPPATTFVP